MKARVPLLVAASVALVGLGGVAIYVTRPGPSIVRAVDVPNLEQVALEEIVASYWGPALFEGDAPCTRMGFDPAVPVMVFRDRPGPVASLLDFARLAGIDAKAFAGRPGGLDELTRMGVVDDVPFSVDISRFPFMEPTPPTGEWPSDQKYLLTFSNRVRYDDRTYLKVVISGGSKFSSGSWSIFFVFDPSGRLLRSEKRPNGCSN